MTRRSGGGNGVVVLLGALGALIFWLSGSVNESISRDAAEFERLQAGDGVTVTATMVGTSERQQAARRRMVTVHCAVYEYREADRTSRLTSDDCARDPDDLPALGSTVPVIYDPDGYAAFVDTEETADGLASDRSRAPWYRWGGLALAVACGAVVLRRLYRRVRTTPV